jgi:outer membrane protein TolC
MRVYRLVGLILILCTNFVSARAQSLSNKLDLTRLIEKAIAENPQLQSAHTQVDVYGSKISQAGALPDPVLGINMLNLPLNTFRFNQEPMSGKQVTLMQAIPFPGKRSLKSEIASDQRNIADAQYREMKNQLIKEVKKAYFELFYIDRALQTVNDNQSILKNFVTIAETKYSVGKGLQQDVLRAQLELSRLINKEISLKQKRKVVQAHLNTLVNQPPDSSLGDPVLPPTANIDTVSNRLMAIAKEKRPLLNSWKLMETQADKKVDLAQKGRLPDFKIGIAFTQRDVLSNGTGGIDFLSGLFSVNIPIYYKRKQKKNIEEMKYSRKMVTQRYGQVRNAVANNIVKNLSLLNKSKKLLDLYKTGIIPQSKQSLQSALSGYQNDKVDFLTLLNNEMSLFNFQLEYYRALTDYHIAVAVIQSEIGSETN